MSDMLELKPIPDAVLDAHHPADAHLTPAEATARCEAGADLVEAAQSCIRASPECLCLDEMTAALAPFIKGLEK